MTKTRIAILFGGNSAEHEISIRSTKAIAHHLDRERFEPLFIYLTRHGKWALFTNEEIEQAAQISLAEHSFLPWEMQDVCRIETDIYFPILHGPNGEDGKIQAMLEMAGKPFVGADSFSSALAMDKITAKILFACAGLKTCAYLYFTSLNFDQIREMTNKKLSYPVFVKPCSLGSSIGISLVPTEEELPAAVQKAFSYDSKILIEKALDKREIEIAVMGNEEIMVSRPGELIPHNRFYDYEDKYLLGKTKFNIPADLNEELENKIKKVAQKAYRSLFLNGMARVDLFLENKTNEVYVNEINTIPGFTEISMFPKLWQLEGISFTQLVTRLVEYGFEHHRQVKKHANANSSY